MKRPRIKADYLMDHFVSYIYTRTKKTDPEITQIDIRTILKRYFELAVEDLALGNTIYLGSRLGNLYVIKQKREIKFNPDTNEIENKLPINFPETFKLWRDYPELKNKRYIRFTNEHSDGYMFRLKYETSKAMYKNKQFYDFKYSKPVKDKLNENILNKKTDAFLNKYEINI